MGVTNVHFVKANNATAALNANSWLQSPVLIKDGDSSGSTAIWYLKFHTEYGWSTGQGGQQSVDISVLPSYVPKAVDAQNNGWDQTTYSLKSYDSAPHWWRNYTQDQWTSAGGATKQIRGGYDWVFPIHNLVCADWFEGHGGKNILGFLYNWAQGNTADYRKAFVYSTRGCDSIKFEVNVATNWGPDPWNVVHSDVASCTQVWDFAPLYHAERASITEEGLWIWYNAGYGWNRADDRYAVYESVIADGRIKIADAARNIWGTVDWAGRVLIPYSRLTQIPTPGTHLITGQIRMNAIWRTYMFDQVGIFGMIDLADIDVDRDGIPDGGTPIEVEGYCNIPTIRGTVDRNGTVIIDVGDSGDDGSGNNNPITTYEVRLIADELMTGMDRYHGPNTRIYFYEPAWGQPLVYGVVGFDQYGRASEMVTTSVPAVQPQDMYGIYRFTPNYNYEDYGDNLDNPDRAIIRFNVDTSEDISPVTETVKLAGRDFNSVFYGRGRTGTFKLNGVLVLDTSPFNRDMGEVVIDEIYDVLIGQPCFVRRADGTRDYVAVTNVTVTEVRTQPWLAKISLTCEKVA